MRRLVLIAAFVASAGCSDDGFQLASGTPDSPSNVSEAGSDTGTDASMPDTHEEDTSPTDSTVVDSGSDTSIVDTSVLDTGTTDTRPLDTGVVDTGSDTGTTDTGTTDTGTTDTGTTDTGTSDSGTVDSGTVDSGTVDSGTVDSGTVPDTSTGDVGPTCPMPPSSATWSVEGLGCSELDTQYRLKAQEARRCNCDADCSEEVARDFCYCKIAVNPGNDAYTFLKIAQDRWSSLGCSTGCPLSVCLPAVKGKCVETTGGKFCSDGTVVVSP